MKGINPVWVAVVAVATIAASAIVYTTWAVKRANPHAVPKADYGKPRVPGKYTADGRRILGDVQIEGPSIVQRDEQGNEVWSARTVGELEVSDEDERVSATGVVWTLKRGKDTVTLRSESMELGWTGGDVTFGGDIDIRAGQTRRFIAKQARFETGTEKVICEGGVRWELDRYSAAADKLVIDVKNRKLRLKGNVKLTART